jgi:hypothetical protein
MGGFVLVREERGESQVTGFVIRDSLGKYRGYEEESHDASKPKTSNLRCAAFWLFYKMLVK